MFPVESPAPDTEMASAPAPGRRRGDALRRGWRAAHEPAEGVPRWARRIAYAVPLVVLPSGIWRLGVLYADDKRGGMLPEWAMNSYVVLLTLLSELLAFTAVGLVARWGEVFPRWTPWWRGRRVPTVAVVAPGAIGATILTLVFTVAAAVSEITNTKINGDPLPDDFPSEVGGWRTFYYYVSYVPLVLWGPMLAVLTYAYWRRRRAVPTGPLGPPTTG